jgi:hypothetical protein
VADDAFASADLVALIRRVFAPRPDDTGIGILVDLPDAVVLDRAPWLARRELAAGWAAQLAEQAGDLGLPTRLIFFRNAHSNNGELPQEGGWLHGGGQLPQTAESLAGLPMVSWPDIFANHSILLAPTQFSATAPLKVAARRFAIRAATMPGFRADMIPALRIDYVEVNRRVAVLAALLTAADGADLLFQTPDGEAFLHIDLRFRQGHASGGLLPEPGTAGNLPSGEAYIVPYEGERVGDPSRTAGILPVELNGEVVRYSITGNRAVAVLPGGERAAAEADRLSREPAYGNLAELGLGVLAAFGVEPVGEILLDEKLGLHMAFGRSDHFGGQIGPADFSSPDAVVHIDRVYVPACQPQVSVRRVDLHLAGGVCRPLIEDDAYVTRLFE